MRRPAPRRTAAKVVKTSLLVMVSLAVMAVGFVAGSASASPTATTKTTTTKTTTTTKATTTTKGTPPATTSTADSPAAHYFVLYGTANAASDHEIVASSAFPNYTKGAVDNYYSMAHSHVDNSPFAEGTASPADTGPVGQTAAAGNAQQPQYADARWPGDPGTAAYGNKGGPYAAAEATEYNATAEASEASNGLSGPTAPSTMAAPAGFDGRLRQALAAWKAKWQSRPKTPVGTLKTPIDTVTTPTATVPTPIATITTPTVTVGGSTITPPVPPPPAPVPLPPVPSTSAHSTTTPSRSLASSSSSADGESLLESSTLTTLDPKTNALVTSGESTLGRVSLGGGQIVIHGIHVSASITNDGTPTYKVAVSVASASIGGVPVTIDQDGVHVAGQGQGLPYQQASDALNGALKQAGIKLFLVGPEVTTSSCGQLGTGTGTGTGSATTPSGQSGTSPTTSSCDQTTSCDQAVGTGTGIATPTTPLNPSGTTPASSCDQTDSCDQAGAVTGTGNGTSTTTTPSNRTGTTPTTSSCGQTSSCPQTATATGTATTRTTTTSSGQTSTTPTSNWCDQSGMTTTTPTTSCKPTGKTTTTSPNDQTGTTTTTTSSGDQTGMAPGSTSSGEETVTATGVHVVFTQPVSQSGVPTQSAEHILGEVFLDSLAVPAGPLPDLALNLSSSSPSSSSSSASSCLGGTSSRTKTSHFAAAGGSSSAGGSVSSSSLSPTASGFTSGSSSTGSGQPTALTELASVLRSKPMWLLLAYLVWQALAVITGASLWNWRRGGAS